MCLFPGILRQTAFVATLALAANTCGYASEYENEVSWIWSKLASEIDAQRYADRLMERAPLMTHASVLQLNDPLLFEMDAKAAGIADTPNCYRGRWSRLGSKRSVGCEEHWLSQHPLPVLAERYGQTAYRTELVRGLVDIVAEPRGQENGWAISYRYRLDLRIWTGSAQPDSRYNSRVRLRFSGAGREVYLTWEKPF